MNIQIDNYSLNTHAVKRTQQRGIKSNTIGMILDFADKVNYSNGANFYEVSKKQIKLLVKNKSITPNEAKELSNKIIIERDGVISTAMHRFNNFKFKDKFTKNRRKRNRGYHA